MLRRLRDALAITAFLSGVVCLAQSTNSGDIRGILTDSTGAVISGVTVTVLNVQTGVAKDFVTNQQGLYDTSSVVAGNYQITFQKAGFEQLVRGPVTIDVGQTTVDGQLQVGASTVTVTVSTDVPLLNTETGAQTQTLEAESMDQLPNVGAGNGPDWQNFVILLPGVTGTSMGAQGSSNPGQESSANGNLPYTNVLEDGATSTLPASANANPAPFDDVDELQVNLSSFSAQYGIGGVIINQITKGGGNHFHGTAYEYFQNDALNAPQFGSSKVPYLRYDDFGGTIGGPVAVPAFRNKAFFFFGYDQIIHNGVSLNHFTVPDTDTLAGNFTGQATLYDPTTQTIAYDPMGNPYPVRQSFASENGGNNALLQMDTVAMNLAKVWPTPSHHPSYSEFTPGEISNGIPTNNFTAQPPSPSPWRRYFGRLDYDITPNHRLTLTDNQGDQGNSNDGGGVNTCPIGCQLGDVDNNNAQITEVWNISPTMINEARMGFTDQLNFFSDAGTGLGIPQQLGWQFAKANVLPTVNWNGVGPYTNFGPATNAVYKEFSYDPSDVVTMIRGKQILHFGGEFAFYRDNATPWGNVNAGTFQFTGVYTQQWTTAACGPTPKYAGQVCPDTTTGNQFADFLLGVPNAWNATITPESGARLKKPQMFVQDDIKVHRNLTVNAGLRYEINHGFNEVKGNEAVFDPKVMNPATNTLGAYWYGSTHANGRNAMQQTVYSTVLPRLGASWLVRPNTTIRGGFGLYAYNFSLDQYGRGMGSAVQSAGSVSDQTNGITPVTQLDGPGTHYGTSTPLPYTSASTSPARFNGQNATWTPYNTPIPKIWQWNFGVERELMTNTVATLTYVASHGFNLPFPTDLNAVPENQLSANDGSLRPYSNYQSIEGYAIEAISNYNSLQATINRRFTKGLSFNFNYVWSHFLDDQDSSGWGSRSGPEYVQHVSSLTLNQASRNYGSSNFDERHVLKGYVVYELPFGIGKTFLNQNRFLDAAVGGWQISTTAVEASGNPFQPYINNANLYTLAGISVNGAGSVVQYPNRVPGVALKSGSHVHQFYNPGAFAAPGNGVFGTLGRNPITGPGLNFFNLSAGKTFSTWEKVKFQIRGDATNVFNHPNFGTPNQALTCPSSGACTGLQGGTTTTAITEGPRSMQLTGRISF
jgi:hypothetical protein